MIPTRAVWDGFKCNVHKQPGIIQPNPTNVIEIL